MGTPPAPNRPSPVPTQVAEGFVSVYYNVVSGLPDSLPKLYGLDSELTHGAHAATGLSQIANIANRIPLVGKPVANIASLSVQQTRSGGYVVVVLGTFEKNGDQALFSQTFVLEQLLDSHKDHFYCRNDVFVELADTNMPGKPPELKKPVVEPPVPREKEQKEKPTEVAPQNVEQVPVPKKEDDVHEPAVEPAEPETPLPPQVPAAVANEGSADAPSEHEEPDHAPEVEQPQGGDLNGVTEEPLQEDPSDEVGATEISPVVEKAEKVVEDKVPNGKVEQERVVRNTPVKKTWASIVSSKEDGAKEVAEAVTVAPTKGEEVTPRAMADQVENIPPAEDGKQMAPQNSVHSHSGQSQRPSNVQNGHRQNYMGGRGGHQRTFGPSAVVQLSTLDPEKLQDPRSLAMELKAEFGQYGFKLRHVEVKAQKGIAFLEYETMEGVRAAVSAWSNGPRNDGLFAGIQLLVSEKRPNNHKWRTGNMRGGRGGTRGGRRNRPASTSMS
eukprot:GFKZ01009467.1.p1 GENE.GFKZ01009467.1~~GFKZ01009467.1.p1  ORF type:complete len:498 (+),score=95.39 GFKZ01009467.1:461-1954(+)